jgi:hypothetical protein
MNIIAASANMILKNLFLTTLPPSALPVVHRTHKSSCPVAHATGTLVIRAMGAQPPRAGVVAPAALAATVPAADNKED